MYPDHRDRRKGARPLGDRAHDLALMARPTTAWTSPADRSLGRGFGSLCRDVGERTRRQPSKSSARGRDAVADTDSRRRWIRDQRRVSASANRPSRRDDVSFPMPTLLFGGEGPLGNRGQGLTPCSPANHGPRLGVVSFVTGGSSSAFWEPVASSACPCPSRVVAAAHRVPRRRRSPQRRRQHHHRPRSRRVAVSRSGSRAIISSTQRARPCSCVA